MASDSAPNGMLEVPEQAAQAVAGFSEAAPFDPSEHSHRRWNPLLRTHVLCSPHRTKRPWQGAEEPKEGNTLPDYDQKCYLCPGNKRAGGSLQNEEYERTFIFENDFAALRPEEVAPIPQGKEGNAHPLLRSVPARGRCYVLCFHPRHNVTIAQMTSAPFTAVSDILPIVKAWTETYERIPRENTFVRFVQIFENKGSAMGCSNPHPHGQIWSLDYIPEEPRKELESMRAYATDVTNMGCAKDHMGRPSMLLTYAQLEMSLPGRPRIIDHNDDFVALVPWWGVWPFEVLILPHQRQIPSLCDMSEREKLALAELLGSTTCRLDNIFECSFPYSMGIHQRPTAKQSRSAEHQSPVTSPTHERPPASPVTERHGRSAGPAPAPTVSQTNGGPQSSTDESVTRETEDLSNYAQFHIHFYPPLLRSASVRKFLVGFELMAEPQRDLTAEQAAARIRACETIHHLHRDAAKEMPQEQAPELEEGKKAANSKEDRQDPAIQAENSVPSGLTTEATPSTEVVPSTEMQSVALNDQSDLNDPSTLSDQMSRAEIQEENLFEQPEDKTAQSAEDQDPQVNGTKEVATDLLI